MIERHPFGSFVPKNSKYLILGSFAGRSPNKNGYDWFYGAKVNQFWPILRAVYDRKLIDKRSKQKLFSGLKIAVADIIYQCERKRPDNKDESLVNIVYNAKGLGKIFKENKIEKIFFTSRFVEKEFGKNFKNLIEKYPEINLITLPSPSPRYAKLSLKDKIRVYKKLLPK